MSRSPSKDAPIVLVLLLAAALRLCALDSPIGGFHAYNEAHYILLAKNFFARSLLEPTADGEHIFLETPPLYPYLVHAVFRLAGVSVLAARAVSVASSLALVLATFLLGRRLFGASAGLAAALLLAVSPVAVLTGRNVQTDSTFLLFLVLALDQYHRTAKDEVGGSPLMTERERALRLAGLFAGLALFTKLFAGVALLGVLLWEIATKGARRWIRDRSRWRAAAIAAALPGAYYGYHALRDPAVAAREVFGGAAAATTFPAGRADWVAFSTEAVWAFSPVVLVMLALGVANALRRPSRDSLLMLSPAAAFAVFYLFVHKHSYYLLTLLPFLALLGGRFLAGLRSRALRAAALGLVLASGSLASALAIASMKIGHEEFARFGETAAALPGTTHHLLVTRTLEEAYGPVLRYFDPRARLVTVEDAAADADGRVRLPEGNHYIVSFIPPGERPPEEGWRFTRTRHGVALFGWTLVDEHPNPHFFRPGRLRVVRAGAGGGPVGFARADSASVLALIPFPAGFELRRGASGTILVPKPE